MSLRIEPHDRPHAIRLLIVWLILSAIGIIAVLQIPYPPGSQTIQGEDQAKTLQLLTAIAAPVFIGVVMMIIYSAIYFRRPTTELVDGPPMLGNTPVQVAWIGISAIVVLFLAFVAVQFRYLFGGRDLVEVLHFRREPGIGRVRNRPREHPASMDLNPCSGKTGVASAPGV